MEGMFKGTGLMVLDLYHGSKVVLKNKMDKFDKSDNKKAYVWAQVKDGKTVTIASISHQIDNKLKSQTKTASHPGLNISPAE